MPSSAAAASLWGLLALIVAGCGSEQGVTGGTPGLLHAGSTGLAEIQLTIHPGDGSGPLGFAPTGMDGTFELLTNQARGPLRLPPGDYRVTLESIGSPVVIPEKFTRPDSTPLKFTWNGSEKLLDLDAPLTIP